ncbi:nicotinate phosphoribosyltransferase, partial [Enterococcus faecium]
VNYLENLKFHDSDFAYLRGLEVYPDGFLEYLQNFEFKATVRSAREGELVIANEPLIQVEGPLAHCQLVDTALLNMVNFQTLIATKEAR